MLMLRRNSLKFASALLNLPRVVISRAIVYS